MKQCLLLTVLLGLCGCASGPPLNLTPAIRATLGTTGIVAGDRPAELDHSTPTTGAASGVWGGLKVWGGNCSELGRGCASVVFLALSPFYVIGGAIYGAVAGESAEAVASAETNLREAWAEMRVAEWIRDLVFQRACDRTAYAVRLLPAPDLPEGDAASGRATLAAQGVTTVLEVRVPVVALVADHAGHNPPMRLRVTADATLTRTHDGKRLYWLSLERKSDPREFLAWGATNAQEFRYHLALLTASLAREIALSVFVLDLPPRREGVPADPARENEAATTEDSETHRSTPQD